MKYIKFKVKAVVRNIMHHSGLNEQNSLLVSVIKHAVTNMLDKMAYIMVKANSVPAFGLCFVILIFLCDSSWREKRVTHVRAPTI